MVFFLHVKPVFHNKFYLLSIIIDLLLNVRLIIDSVLISSLGGCAGLHINKRILITQGYIVQSSIETGLVGQERMFDRNPRTCSWPVFACI